MTDNGAFWGCTFCQGTGCLACPGEADKAYAREFPGGPMPVAVFKTDSPDDMEALRECVGREAVEKAFEYLSDTREEFETRLAQACSGKTVEPVGMEEIIGNLQRVRPSVLRRERRK